ncbi:Hypothetical predicted protein [Cloeon dipterum]|uniref:Uncharacterized protein n=1 Tax=Cloeon dipterum TaxID=197152 RepID=A0A8S1CAC6_9INSE|nr:Hypothetical predicted protein [Cloeon dipterum]
MEQIVSSSNNPENGLNLQPIELAAALSPDEEFDNLVKNLLDCNNIEYKKQILVKTCSKLTKINFAKVMDLFPEDEYISNISGVLLAIACNASNISDFQIMEGFFTRQDCNLNSMSEEMVSAIAKMTKLEVLKVRHFSITFFSLMKLCGMLPSLKTLFFKIKAEPNFKIYDMKDFQKSFGHLEIFQFCPFSNEKRLEADFRESLTLKCILYLPNLIILGDPEYFVDMLPTLLDYQSLATCKQSKLSTLTLSVDREIKENALSKFPDVRQLHIKWVENNQPSKGHLVPELLGFQHLTQLVMYDLGTNYSYYLKKFLEVYGKCLTHLVLHFQSLPIDFVMLFNMICCSSFDNLDLLAMSNLDVQPFTVDENNSVLCQLNCVAHQHFGRVSCESLNHLELEFVFNHTYAATYVHLSKILSVPNLEKVGLTRVPTSLDELWKTMLLVAKRAILKKVTHFKLHLLDKDMIEKEIIAITRCCQSIKEELLLSGKEKGEMFVEVTP